MSTNSLPMGAGDHLSNEELRYMYVSNVKVSEFVSVKLLNKGNYIIWKKQMVCLLDSQGLRGLVDPGCDVPPGISSNIMQQYNNLVQGWIYGSLGEDMLKLLICITGGPREIWSALETICDLEEEAASTGGSSRLEIEIYEEKLRYEYASSIKISNFVSVTLLTKSNYTIWRKEMLSFLDSHNLRGLVEYRGDPLPEIKSPDIRQKYKSLVKGWILHSLSPDFIRQYESPVGGWILHSLRPGIIQQYESPYLPSLWEKVENFYLKPEDYGEWDHKKRVQIVLEQGQVTSTTPDSFIPNEKLLKAVVDGRWWDAKRIIFKNNKDFAEEVLTGSGHTALHIAVREGRNNFLERLLHLIHDENKLKVTTQDQWTALREAAYENNKRAAQLLVKKCESLLYISSDEWSTPLEIAYNENSLDTFLYLWEAVKDVQRIEAVKVEKGIPYYAIDLFTSTQARINKIINFNILEEAISTKQYGLASRLVDTFPQVAMQDDRLLMAMTRTFPDDLGFGEALICPSLKNFHQIIVNRSSSLFNTPRALYVWADNVLWATRSLKEAMWLLQETVLILLVVPIAVLYPLYQLMRLLILVIFYPLFLLYFLMWNVLAIPGTPIKRIETKRKKYQEAKDLLYRICNHIDNLGNFDGYHPCYYKVFLEAARLDAYEVFDELVSRLTNLIDQTGEDQECFQIAITNRSHKIFNLISQVNFLRKTGRFQVDSCKNNILHLAGRLAPERVLTRTRGAALQLQQELQWFQEVEKLMKPEDLVKQNNNMETPEMVFSKHHTNLVKEGEQWMKTTSEACSITAVLIVTIVFAAAITVPGGNNENGIPLFKNEIAFIMFAVCDAISLFSAVSSLLAFLSILTTRFAEKDFLVSLPTRLIIGLCTLFVSTGSMVVAFSAVLYLVFCDQRPWMLAPIGGLTCMPIAVIVTLQVPLLFDLFKSTHITIFGNQRYIHGSKFISNHPLYEYE